MLVLATWIGLTVGVIAVVALFTAVQHLCQCFVFNEWWSTEDWAALFGGTLLMAAVVWFPGSLGWVIMASGAG